MVLLRSGVTTALIASSFFGYTLAVPLIDKLRSLSPGARDLLKRSTPAAPRFVVYSDQFVNPLPSVAEIRGFNVFALSFWLTSGAADMALVWQEFSQGERANYLREYNNAGISLIVSAFGATETPTTSGANAVNVANELASWVRRYGLHGVDVDYEDFNAFDNLRGAGEEWVITLTRQLRTHLPQGEYILSHAPVAPWFSPHIWKGGGYLHIHRAVGSLIDWYNVQFYNQGTREYTSCYGLITASSSSWPESAIFQIAANGVDLNKLVIGKPGKSSDVNNGYMSTGKLAWCVSKAHERGWNAGVMSWEYPDAATSWISAVRGNTF